jgi:hypothetical protein
MLGRQALLRSGRRAPPEERGDDAREAQRIQCERRPEAECDDQKSGKRGADCAADIDAGRIERNGS